MLFETWYLYFKFLKKTSCYLIFTFFSFPSIFTNISEFMIWAKSHTFNPAYHEVVVQGWGFDNYVSEERRRFRAAQLGTGADSPQTFEATEMGALPNRLMLNHEGPQFSLFGEAPGDPKQLSDGRPLGQDFGSTFYNGLVSLQAFNNFAHVIWGGSVCLSSFIR